MKNDSINEFIETWFIPVRDVLISILGLVSFVLGICLAYQEKVTSAGICFAAGLLLLIFSSLKGFESFKGFGIEAKTRKLDVKLQEAEKLFGRIKLLTESMAEITFFSLTNDRWDNWVPHPEMYKIASNIKNQLEECGTPKSLIDKYMNPWYETVIIDLMTPVFDAISNTNGEILDRCSQDIQMSAQEVSVFDKNVHDVYVRKWQLSEQFSKDVMNRRNQRDYPSLPGDLKRLIDQLPNSTAKEKKQIKNTVSKYLVEAEYFLRSHEFKNPTLWLDLDRR